MVIWHPNVAVGDPGYRKREVEASKYHNTSSCALYSIVICCLCRLPSPCSGLKVGLYSKRRSLLTSLDLAEKADGIVSPASASASSPV